MLTNCRYLNLGINKFDYDELKFRKIPKLI